MPGGRRTRGRCGWWDDRSEDVDEPVGRAGNQLEEVLPAAAELVEAEPPEPLEPPELPEPEPPPDEPEPADPLPTPAPALEPLVAPFELDVDPVPPAPDDPAALEEPVDEPTVLDPERESVR